MLFNLSCEQQWDFSLIDVAYHLASEKRRQNDLYRQFIEECIIEADETLSLTELYSYFKDWFKEGWPNMQLPIKNQAKEYFQKLWGEPGRGCRWRGYRIRTLEEEVAMGEAVILNPSDLINYNDLK